MPMNMTPEQFFEAFVEGNYQDFIDNPGSIRHVFNAAIASSHMADHYYNYYKKHDPSRVSMYRNLGDYIEYISNTTIGYFKDIRSIANAYKHLYTGVKPSLAKHSSISSAGTIEVVQFYNDHISEVHEDWATGTMNTVVYTTKQGEERNFIKALKEVLEFWKNQDL